MACKLVWLTVAAICLVSACGREDKRKEAPTLESLIVGRLLVYRTHDVYVQETFGCTDEWSSESNGREETGSYTLEGDTLCVERGEERFCRQATVAKGNYRMLALREAGSRPEEMHVSHPMTGEGACRPALVRNAQLRVILPGARIEVPGLHDAPNRFEFACDGTLTAVGGIFHVQRRRYEIRGDAYCARTRDEEWCNVVFLDPSGEYYRRSADSPGPAGLTRITIEERALATCR